MKKLLVICAVMLALAPAFALAQRGAVLVPQIKPAGSPELRDRMHDAIARGITTPDVEIVIPAETRMRIGSSDELMNCAGAPACTQRAAATLRASWVVTAEISALGKDYSFKLKVHDATGRIEAHAEESCDICTVKEADETAARTAAKLLPAIRKLAAAATLANNAPQTPERATSKQPVAQPKPVAPPAEPSPPVAAPEAVTPPAEMPKSKVARPYLYAGIALAAVGLVGIVVGAPLIAIDGNPTCDLPNPRKSCKSVYDTVGIGAAFTAIGVAAAATSGVMFYLDHRSRKKAAVTWLRPLIGGLMIGADGQF